MNTRSTRSIFRGTLLVALLPALLATSSAGAQVVTVTAAEGEVHLTLSPKPNAEPAITLSFDGTLHPQGLALTGSEAPAVLSPAAAFAARYLAAWREGTYEQMTSFWAAAERGEIGRFFPEASFADQRRLYSDAAESRLWLELDYGDHVLLLVEHRGLKSTLEVELVMLARQEERLTVSYALLAEPVTGLFRAGLGERVVASLRRAAAAP